MAEITLIVDPGASQLSLHDRANGWRLLGFDAPTPETDSQWAFSADTEGERRANLRYRNRVITARVLVEKSSDVLLEAAENVLGQKVGKLAREGGDLRFGYPSGTTVTFEVLEASFTRTFDVADMARKRVHYEVVFVCLPFGLGAEEDLGDNTETTLPVLVFTEASVPGDVPGLGRLVVDDDSGVDQWWLAWGLQSRHYSADATAALFYEAEGRTAMGGSAVATGPTGASGGASNNVMRNTALATDYLAILSTQATSAGAHLSHVGTFHVYARVQVPTANTGLVTVALQWGEADFLRYTTNEATTIPAAHEGQWRLVDLGLVSLDEVTSGTQKWEGRIIAKSTVAGDDVDVDYLLLVPAGEGSGIVSGVSRAVIPTSYSGQDSFTGTTATNALDARVAPTGGTWDTSGDATDFAFDDDSLLGAAGEHIKRSAVSGTNGRFAILGATDYVNVQVEALVLYDLGGGASWTMDQGVIARWTDSSNYLRASFERAGSPAVKTLKITQVVAGVETVVASAAFPAAVGSSAQWWKVRLTVNSGGRAAATVMAGANSHGIAVGTVMVSCEGSSSALATGGTLATGEPGIFDRVTGSTATTRYYDDFVVATGPVDAAVFASQSLEIRSDRVLREDSAGATWTKPSLYEGDYLLVPPAGVEGRTSRLLVKASRSDPLELDSAIDDISAKLFVTPRYLIVPEA